MLTDWMLCRDCGNFEVFCKFLANQPQNPDSKECRYEVRMWVPIHSPVVGTGKRRVPVTRRRDERMKNEDR